MHTTFVIVDDQTAICDLISELLENRKDFRVLGTAHNGEAGIAMTERLRPDILILDIRLPDIEGFEILRRILTTQPNIRVLVFTSQPERKVISSMIASGASGFVPKTARLSEFRNAIDAIAEGGTWFSESLLNAITESAGEPSPERESSGEPLTKRETQIAIMLTQSLSSNKIARILAVSPSTVMNHRTNLMRKLGVRNVAGVIQHLVREGIFDPSGY